MRTYDFSGVDFSQPEIMASLARAYTILLQASEQSEATDADKLDEATLRETTGIKRGEADTPVYYQLPLW